MAKTIDFRSAAAKMLFVAVFCWLAGSGQAVLADGMMFRPQPTAWESWMGQQQLGQTAPVGQLVNENSQQAFIQWDDKKQTEKMLIVVESDPVPRYVPQYDRQVVEPQGPENAAATITPLVYNQQPLYWLVPIKSACDQIRPYHFDKFSQQMEYLTVEDQARNNLRKLKSFAFAWHGWPLLGKIVRPSDNGRSYNDSIGLSNSATFGGVPKGATQEVQVYKRLESFGVATEILSAQSIAALDQYLLAENISLSPEVKNKLDDYLGGDYCFSVSKETDPDRQGKLALMLEFQPGKQPFYPMYLTSAYGPRQMRIELYVGGLRKAEMGQRILPTQTLVMEQPFTVGKDQTALFPEKSLVTKLVLDEPASNFKADIELPADAGGRWFVGLLLWGWILIALIAMGLSLFVAWFLFSERWLAIGLLGGVFGLLGAFIAATIKKPALDFKNWKLKLNDPASYKPEQRDWFRWVRFWNLIVFILIVSPLALLWLSLADFSANEVVRFLFGRAEEWAAVTFMFIGPLSLLLIIMTSAVLRIFQANKVDLATRELLLNLSRPFTLIIQIALSVAALFFFLGLGVGGWIAGGIVALAMFGWLTFAGRDFNWGLKTLAWLPLALCALLLTLKPGVVIVGFEVVYPFLVLSFFTKHFAQFASISDQQSSAEKAVADFQPLPGAISQRNGLLLRLAIFSLLMVLVWFGLDWTWQRFLLPAPPVVPYQYGGNMIIR
jgi:hypothetical protein